MPVLFGTSASLPAASPADGSVLPIGQGKQTDAYVSEMHSRYYTASYRGNVFFGATLAAGIVVPFIAATLASKFTLNNPSTSLKLVELIDINLLQVPGTALVTGCGLAFQANCTTTGGAPTLTTASAGGVRCAAIGSPNAASAGLYTTSALTNVAIANLSLVIWLYNNVATTIISNGPTNYNFDGKIIMLPDCAGALVDSITATQSAAAVSISWAEWPL